MKLVIHALSQQFPHSKNVCSCKYLGHTDKLLQYQCTPWGAVQQTVRSKWTCARKCLWKNPCCWSSMKLKWVIGASSLLYSTSQTGSWYPMVGNTSETERQCLIAQLTDTSFWSLPDNAVYPGYSSASSSSKLTAPPTTRTRTLRRACWKLRLHGTLCPLRCTKK